MNPLALACPGQGILPSGCLYHFKPYYHLFKHILDEIDHVLNESFSENLLKPNDNSNWNYSTSNAQPAIVTATYVTNFLMKEIHGIDLVEKSSFLLGHSLGEYSALVLADSVSLPKMIQVVRQRGLLMENLIQNLLENFIMKTLLVRPNKMDQAIQLANDLNVLACINNKLQISISGNPSVVESTISSIKPLKSFQLPVRIPFHNELLSSIEPQLASLVPLVNPPRKPIISNLTGEISTGNVFQNTVNDNSKPVQWKKSMHFLFENGITDVINFGPGSVLSDINKSFPLKSHPLRTTEDMLLIANLINQ